MPSRSTILVIGDVHGHWGARDIEYLEHGDQDLVLFVGDLGDENVDIVRAVASLQCPKYVLLGNHDAWASFSQKASTDALREMLDVLGKDHIGYSVRDIDAAQVSVIGARPFSWGGPDLRSPELYGELFGVRSHEDSAEAIYEASLAARYDDLVILAHNGPHGLSANPRGIYGKDFGKRPGGDWGDRDLRLAIDKIDESGRQIRAVIAGHMHHKLHPQIGGYRNRFARRGDTSFVNAAVVPRYKRTEEAGEMRHYLRTTWCEGALESVDEIWVDELGEVREVDEARFKELTPQR